MSVQILYGDVDKVKLSDKEDKLCGLCFLPPHQKGEDYGETICAEKCAQIIHIDLGKHPPLSELNSDNPIEIALNFGSVPVESKHTREIIIHDSTNAKAPLPTEFLVEPREELREQYDKVFHILLQEHPDVLSLVSTPSKDAVACSRKTKIKRVDSNRRPEDAHFKFCILFKPTLPGMSYTTTLSIWLGKYPIKLRCHGFSEGPLICFSKNTVNFGGQYYGMETLVKVKVFNRSRTGASFQFDTDNTRSVFKVCPKSGFVPAHGKMNLNIFFQPHKPQTYYKRVYCLVHMQNPQYLDLIGVCIPRPFLVDRSIDFIVSVANTHFLPVPKPSFDEYFSREIWGVILSHENFNFGRKTLRFLNVSKKLGSLPSTEIETSSFKLTLRSVLPYDVILEWVPDPMEVFIVRPMSAFLNSNHWVTFELRFDPGLPDTFYSGQLECYVYPTTYIWPNKAGPPWKLTKTCKTLSAAPTTEILHSNIFMASVPSATSELADPTDVSVSGRTGTSDHDAGTATYTGEKTSGKKNPEWIPDPLPTNMSIEYPTVWSDQQSSLESSRGSSRSPSRTRSKKKKRKVGKYNKSVKSALTAETTATNTPPPPVYTPVHGRIPFVITIKNNTSCSKHRIIALKHLITTDPDNPEICEDYVTECSPPEEAAPVATTGDATKASVASIIPTLTEREDRRSEGQLSAVPRPVSISESKNGTPSSLPAADVVAKAGASRTTNKPDRSGSKKKTKKTKVAKPGRSATEVVDKKSKKKLKNKEKKHKKEKPTPGPPTTPVPIPSTAEGGDSFAEEVEEPPPTARERQTLRNTLETAMTETSIINTWKVEVGSLHNATTADTNVSGDSYKTTDEFCGGGYENWSTLDVDPALLEKREAVFKVPETRSSGGGGDSGVSGPTELAVPLCLTVRLTGHTYSSVSQPPVPSFSLPSRVTMSPTLPQQRETRTFIMKNHSDIPLLFDIKDLDEREVYTPKPTIGVIAGNRQQIFTMSMNTTNPESAAYEHDFTVNVNVIDQNQLSISGYAEVPELILTILSDPTGAVSELICPTTLPGFCTQASFTMKNPSRFHYRYSFEFADDNQELRPVFTPSPSSGILAPYDCVQVTWKFVPYQFESYSVPWKFRFEVMGGKTNDSYWNAVYEFYIPLEGIGKQCHVTAYPALLEFDQIQIYETVTKCFTVVNDGPSAFVAKLVPRHEQWLEWYSSQVLVISPSLITLQPGESIEIKTTVRPEKLIMYNFSIDYEPLWGEKEDSNEYAIVVAHKLISSLLYVTFMGNHAIARITDIVQVSRHQSWDSEQCWGMFSIEELNHLLTPLKNAAREGPLHDVPTVQFRFPNAPVGSPPVVFTLLLTSIGDSILYWRLHTLPPKNSNSHEMKNKGSRQTFSGNSDSETFLTALWAEKYAQTFHHLKHESLRLSAMKNTEHYRVTPTQNIPSQLKQQMIHFKFFYGKPGYHKIPILLRIYPAIFVWLELHCHVLQMGEPSLQPMHNKEMIFHPISLSDLSPPIQSFWLYNGSTVTSSFKVDMEYFKRVKGRNFGHCCIECLTPEGAILPKSWGAVKLRFSPLEYKSYDTHLKMKLNNTENWIFAELKGTTSIVEDIDLRPKAPTHPSEIESVFVPVALRPRRVIFQHYIPTGDRASSVVFITNLSATHSVSFSWPEVTYVNSTSIKFLPEYGTLAPKEQLACQVLIQAGDVNQILSTHIRCWIEDETALHQFGLKNKLWRGELVEYEDVQVVTKKEGPHVVRRQSIHNQPAKPDSFSQLLTISCYIGSVFGTLDNIWSPELCKMPFSDPIGIQPLPGGDGRQLALSPFNRHLALEVLTQVFWDMTLLSPNWPSYVRAVTKRQAVYFDDYKNSEKASRIPDDPHPLQVYTLPQKTKEDIMEFVTFTMLQEMTDQFAIGDEHWTVLDPSDLR